MFERRLKILLAGIFLLTLVILVRAAQLQVFQGGEYRQQAMNSLKRSQLIETTRGRILDVRGRELAIDEPCTDATVDYRAIERDPEWIRAVARERLRAAGVPAARRAELLKDEITRVNLDIDRMWYRLAELSNRSIDEIEQIKAGIRQRVQMRQRFVWYRKYAEALARHENKAPEPWYRQWLIGEGGDAPQIDSFAVTVAEQAEQHVILRAIDDRIEEVLEKNRQQLPGLELRHSKHRVYPNGEAACHVLGRLSNVTREDLEGDPNNEDELRQYYPNDLVGRSGAEALYEQVLRGSRGRVERYIGRDEVLQVVEPVAGRDVRLSIDIELQREIMDAMRAKRTFGTSEVREEQHGAVVVIDVPTGEVRALVSYPGYDLNRFDTEYARLVVDDINKPLINRATLAQFEPGSTVKTLIGLGALADGTIQPDTTIECTGYLVLGGNKFDFGRCWTAKQYAHMGGIPFAHHQIPYEAPHPTGFLNVADGLERSCNVFFETVGDRLGLPRIAYWMDRFGLGRPTGIGLPEASGRIPDPAKVPAATRRITACFSSIGQGPVAATPLQMANLAATIARGGVWMRPHLAMGAEASVGRPGIPERADLGLPSAAVALVREGMRRVVNSPAGTGGQPRRTDMIVAGKTGSAQAPKLSIPQRDEAGQIIRTAGRVQWLAIAPNAYPWYQGTGEEKKDLAHAWYIGFAPADRPRLAFAVLVEYGGSGGRTAGAVAADVLEACKQHGYFSGN